VNVILICCFRFQIFNLYLIFEEFTSIFYITTLPYILVMKHESIPLRFSIIHAPRSLVYLSSINCIPCITLNWNINVYTYLVWTWLQGGCKKDIPRLYWIQA